jgi:hypothetical protein
VETYRGLTGRITGRNERVSGYTAATWGKAAFQAVPADVMQGVTEAADGISKWEFFELAMEAIRSGGT